MRFWHTFHTVSLHVLPNEQTLFQKVMQKGLNVFHTDMKILHGGKSEHVLKSAKRWHAMNRTQHRTK